MPIKEAKGSIFDSKAQVLVNPVNCVGVMGRGLAKEFAKRFPEIIRWYKHDCDYGNLLPGRVEFYRIADGRSVACFATKDHWKDRSDLDDIYNGLSLLRDIASIHEFESIAIPAIGCGLGGLRWEDVQPMISENLGDLDCMTWVYPPL